MTPWEQTGGDDAARGAEILENGLVGLVGQCDGQDARRQPSCDLRGQARQRPVWVGLWGPEAGHWFPPARETGEVETQTTDQARTAPSEEGQGGEDGKATAHRLSITFAVPPAANKSCPISPSTTQSGQSLPPLGGAAKGMGPEDWFFLEEVQHLLGIVVDVKL